MADRDLVQVSKELASCIAGIERAICALVEAMRDHNELCRQATERSAEHYARVEQSLAENLALGAAAAERHRDAMAAQMEFYAREAGNQELVAAMLTRKLEVSNGQ